MQSKNLTTEECKRVLFKVGLKFGVSPKLISERLLDAQDKCDMLNGEIPVEMLEVAVLAWKDAGQPEYSTGQTARMDVKKGSNHPQILPVVRWQDEPLRPPFVRHSEIESQNPEPETA